jgi:hypothetical protein
VCLDVPLPACPFFLFGGLILDLSHFFDYFAHVTLRIIDRGLASIQLGEELSRLPIKRRPEFEGYFVGLGVHVPQGLQQPLKGFIYFSLDPGVPLQLPVSLEKIVVGIDGAHHLDPKLVPQLPLVFPRVVEHQVGPEGRFLRALVHVVDGLQGLHHSAQSVCQVLTLAKVHSLV